MTPMIKSSLSPQNSFISNVVVIGDPRVFVSETKGKNDLFKTIEEQSFTENAFLSFFGENSKKMNYNISFKKAKACLLKNMNAACSQE